MDLTSSVGSERSRVGLLPDSSVRLGVNAVLYGEEKSSFLESASRFRYTPQYPSLLLCWSSAILASPVFVSRLLACMNRPSGTVITSRQTPASSGREDQKPWTSS